MSPHQLLVFDVLVTKFAFTAAMLLLGVAFQQLVGHELEHAKVALEHKKVIGYFESKILLVILVNDHLVAFQPI